MMKTFQNLSVRTKLLLSHGLIVVMALLLAGAGIYGVILSANRMDRMQSVNVAATQAVGDIMYATADLQLVTTTMVTLPASKADLQPPLEKAMADDVALMGTAAQTLYDGLFVHPDIGKYPEILPKVEEIGRLIAVSGDQRLTVLDIKANGDANTAYLTYDTGYRQTLLQIQTLTTELKEMLYTLTTADYTDCVQTNGQLAVGLVSVTVLALVAGLVSAFVVSRNIRNPIQQLVVASLQMQQGHLALPMSLRTRLACWLLPCARPCAS